MTEGFFVIYAGSCGYLWISTLFIIALIELLRKTSNNN